MIEPKAAKWKLDDCSDKAGPILFWKPDEPYGYFCQWYPSDIVEDGITFGCCEQYMMYHNAKTFNDIQTVTAVLSESKPAKQKGLGRQVKGFAEEEWDKVKYEVVVQANSLKFGNGDATPGDKFVYPPDGKPDQDETVSLKRLLLATGDRELAEASRFDSVWGIGYKEDDALTCARKSWGQNLLGKALMEVRRRLRETPAEKESGD